MNDEYEIPIGGSGKGCFWFLLGVAAVIVAVGFARWLVVHG